MSRIRNTLRFQSPEERVLNGLLALVLVVLITVAIAKVRDDRIEAAPQVKGISLTRQPTKPTARHAPTSTSTATATTSTSGAISAADLIALGAAMQANERRASRTTTTTAVGPPAGTTPTLPPPTVSPVTTTTTSTTTTSTTTPPTTTTTTRWPPPLLGG